MSVCYWVIEGIGLNAEDVRPFLDTEKLIKLLNDQCPSIEKINPNDFDIDDYLGGNIFDNLADLLTHCDDTDSLTFSSDDESSSYLYYPPSMPWHQRPEDPQTEEEVYKRIVKAVQKVASITEDSLRKMIDNDLYIVCCA